MKCEICKKRNANIDYAESTMSYTHGFISHICRKCYINLIKDRIKKYKSNLKVQEKLMKEEKK